MLPSPRPSRDPSRPLSSRLPAAPFPSPRDGLFRREGRRARCVGWGAAEGKAAAGTMRRRRLLPFVSRPRAPTWVRRRAAGCTAKSVSQRLGAPRAEKSGLMRALCTGRLSPKDELRVRRPRGCHALAAAERVLAQLPGPAAPASNRSLRAAAARRAEDGARLHLVLARPVSGKCILNKTKAKKNFFFLFVFL